LIAGTRLAAYGHGDWNDSLQPADPAMRERLCSAWTVTLHYQTLVTLGSALDRLGFVDQAADLRMRAGEVAEDFQRLLMVDNILAGFAYFHENAALIAYSTEIQRRASLQPFGHDPRPHERAFHPGRRRTI
jgi:hypothetical protein